MHYHIWLYRWFSSSSSRGAPDVLARQAMIFDHRTQAVRLMEFNKWDGKIFSCDLECGTSMEFDMPDFLTDFQPPSACMQGDHEFFRHYWDGSTEDDNTCQSCGLDKAEAAELAEWLERQEF